MTNKILITVKVPLLEEEYDIFVPVSKKIDALKFLLVKAINELTNGDYPIKTNIILLSENGDMFANNLTVKDSNIKNGDKIILI